MFIRAVFIAEEKFPSSSREQRVFSKNDLVAALFDIGSGSIRFLCWGVHSCFIPLFLRCFSLISCFI